MAAPPIPSVGFSFPNNNLGSTPASPSNIIAVIGACTGPVAVDTPRSIGGSPENVVTSFGYGPGADLGANLVQGGATVVMVRATSTGGTPTAVTHTGTGASVMTVTGTGFDQYTEVIVTCVRAGTAQSDPEPGFTVSLDGGQTTSNEIRVPASGVYSGLADTTGLALNFTAATMVVGDTYVFSVPYPTVSAASITSALTSLRLSTEPYSMLYVAGPFDRADVDTITTAVGLFKAKKRFIRAFVETVDADGDTEADWMAALGADFAGYASDLMYVSAGYEPTRSVVLNAVMWRSVGWAMAVRASLVAVSRDLGARPDGGLVPFQGGALITKPTRDLPDGYFIHDEALNPGLNADQFATIMSEVGLPGYFVTNPNLFSGPVSDYSLLQYGRTTDEIARLTNIYFTQQLSVDVLLNAQGLILEKEAARWEKGNDASLSTLVNNQNVSFLQTTVGRTANIINNEPIPVTVRWQPKGYPKTFAVTIAVSRTAT